MWRLKLYRDKWCAVRRHEGRTQRVSLSTKDRAAAERALRDLQVERQKDLIGDIVPAYIEDKREQGARSIKAMEWSWKALKPTFAHLRPDQVTRPQCRLYARSRRASNPGLSNGTIIKDLGVLKAALKWAKMDREAVFEMPATPPPRDRYITRDEMERLAKSAETAHTELFIRLAWATAGRASAILELTWDRVDFQEGLFDKDGKPLPGQIRLATSDGRRKGRATVPMTGSIRAALEEAYKVRTCDHVIEWGGDSIKNISKAFRRACERAGLSGVSPHILRHSAAVRMVSEGVDLYKVAQILGHTDPRITFRVYARFRPEHMADAVAALE